MTAATAQLVLSILALAALPVCAWIAYRLGKRHAGKSWRRIHVLPTHRGPNADAWYWTTSTSDGHAIDLTDEQLLAAKVSANHHRSLPHTFTDAE